MVQLFKRHTNIFLYGLIVTFFSGMSQTFLISLFNQDIQSEFSLSRTQISSLYSAATLIASFALPFLGRLIDKNGPLKMSIVFALCTSIGFIIIGSAQNSIFVFLGYLVIRGFGQAAFPLVGITAINRSFGKFRGKALGIITIGRSVGEGLLPIILTSIIAFGGWRFGFYSLGISLIIIFCPTTFLLIRNFTPHPPLYQENQAIQNNHNLDNNQLKDIYRDKRIYLLLFTNVFLAFILTGIFFQQPTILNFKNWDASIWAQGFSFYAITQLAFSIIFGHLVDKFSARTLLPLILIPLLIGMFPLMYWSSPLACFLFLSLAGASIGTSVNVRSAFFAEVYGTKHLGTIKSIDATFVVIATSIAPVLFAYILDLNVPLDIFLLGLTGQIILGIILFAICSIIYRN